MKNRSVPFLFFGRRGPTDDTAAAVLLVLPATAGLLLFIVLPFALAVGMSFTNLRLGSPLPLEFVGLRQYARIFAEESVLRALLNNLIFASVVVPLQTALALALALLLNRRVRGIVVFRALFFLPVVFPLSLVAVVWVLLYAPGPDGVLNSFLRLITFGAWEPIDFLHHPTYALPAVMLTSIWQGVGFQMIVLLAGLQEVPTVLHDAAAVDGAGAWRRFRHVTLPQLRSPLIFVVVVTTILSFRVFDQVRIMTQGGPNDASTTVVFEAVRASFDRAQVARGAAITVTFFLIVLAITLLQRRFLRQEAL
ncbi:MAG: sugar ABC transporter permease [Gammaproteobacteria bacterium]|nr:sugar ABC transporter permease [Gammaproteobacteria bacterium]NIR84061.1 sugar ABC transporter permease [Gammaproteobacteria bacterium]NIR89205.1 sugar ABC transporter permease [Gammaproteobacteria bacterium]NIU05007.1 sugar ABC transporter permease [Gammaproteobacteria bacterium]NIV52173.1 ABC transporter permease subunit [Gammaproteobacteria bacterium]